jgi:hypothetical protein
MRSGLKNTYNNIFVNSFIDKPVFAFLLQKMVFT